MSFDPSRASLTFNTFNTAELAVRLEFSYRPSQLSQPPLLIGANLHPLSDRTSSNKWSVPRSTRSSYPGLFVYPNGRRQVFCYFIMVRSEPLDHRDT